ncbi:hypothetical protein BHE97_13510 [Aeromicrobium sp. PE09-221]|uniref:helix-turn-helix transcriptional regulator n=1 Tax=Aeromicrobium sp. PE09-221 TaxID=1898043 RepID=UPI000B3EB8C3|nr:WYL domain-containing protein [Aeromicrobium sp. PE09-221]OUZ08247.1 hypothetical protein BHE97_13510 [Aeromicrobium sp. PE09-221]
MTTSVQRVQRMLAMVPYLQSNAGIPVTEVAEAFGVSVAQVTKDLSLLMMTGVGEYHGDLIDIDVGALEEDGVVFLRDADFMTRPLAFSAREASALIVALRTLRDTATGDQLPAVDGALAKLEGEVGALAPVDVRLPPVDSRIKDTVLSAHAHGHRLHIVYATESRDRTTSRDVDPHKVFTARGQLYVSGWCHLAEDTRTFRLDRITEATELDTPVAVRPNETSATVEAVFVPGPETPHAVLELAPEARWLIDEYDAEIIDEGADGRVSVRLYGTDAAWLRRLVLRHATTVRVLEPAVLRADVSAHARAALEAYTDEVTD